MSREQYNHPLRSPAQGQVAWRSRQSLGDTDGVNYTVSKLQERRKGNQETNEKSTQPGLLICHSRRAAADILSVTFNRHRRSSSTKPRGMLMAGGSPKMSFRGTKTTEGRCTGTTSSASSQLVDMATILLAGLGGIGLLVNVGFGLKTCTPVEVVKDA